MEFRLKKGYFRAYDTCSGDTPDLPVYDSNNLNFGVKSVIYARVVYFFELYSKFTIKTSIIGPSKGILKTFFSKFSERTKMLSLHSVFLDLRGHV